MQATPTHRTQRPDHQHHQHHQHCQCHTQVFAPSSRTNPLFADVQLDQQEDDLVDQANAEISREVVFQLVEACKESSRDDIEIAKLKEMCEQSGVPLGATSGILELIVSPDDTSGRVAWKNFVVALCAQVGGIEDVTGFVRLLLDPGMFGSDEGRIATVDFIELFNWWSSIDISISAQLKAALFTAISPETRGEVCPSRFLSFPHHASPYRPKGHCLQVPCVSPMFACDGPLAPWSPVCPACLRIWRYC